MRRALALMGAIDGVDGAATRALRSTRKVSLVRPYPRLSLTYETLKDPTPNVGPLFRTAHLPELAEVSDRPASSPCSSPQLNWSFFHCAVITGWKSTLSMGKSCGFVARSWVSIRV